MFKPRVILHPTDFSERSQYAFQVGVDLAQQNGARMLVLHVVETLGPENVTFGEAVSEIEPDAYRRRLEQELRRQVRPPDDVPVTYLLTAGDPAREIVRVAREQACDLIVMGTHGRTGLWDRLLMGSIAEQVVRIAPCPVLVSKPAVTKPVESSQGERT